MTQPSEQNQPDPLAPWDEAMIQETQRVWSRAYGRVVSRSEALEILGNVRWLAKTLETEVKRRSQS